MNRKNLFLFLLCVLSVTETLFAQTQTVLDGAYVREHNPTRKVISYPYLREADVMWAKRIWQVIDLKQKNSFNFSCRTFLQSMYKFAFIQYKGKLYGNGAKYGAGT